MMDVPARPPPRVELGKPPTDIAARRHGKRSEARRKIVLRGGEFEEISERTFGDAEAAVHIGFAKPEIGVAQHPPKRRGAVEGDRHGLPGSVANCKCAALAERDFQRASPHMFADDALEPTLHRYAPLTAGTARHAF